MKIRFINTFLIIFFLIIFNYSYSFANTIKKIEIMGNERISKDTIKLFSKISLNDKFNKQELNLIIKRLYETNFFKNITVSFENNILLIDVVENPIIENIDYRGIKAKKILKLLKENTFVKPRSSYNEINLKKEKKRLQEVLKNLGYYRAKLEIYVENKKNNLVSLVYKFDLGKKAKIKKISFVGNKLFKDKKLRRIIVSSEYKFWKFLTGRKYLNENLVEFDKRLLTNFYKNNGYYNVKVNSSFAKMINDDEFELVFNIDAKSKVFFGDLSLDLPSDYDENNFTKIKKLFTKIRGNPYSINIIDKILDEIDLIASIEQYQFVNSTVVENIIENKLNLVFKISETEKYYVKKNL